ncbi:MAG: hypothetical protein ABF542_12715 [Gluconobacter sp.]
MARLYDSQKAVLRATDGKILLDTGVIPGSIDDFASRLRSLLPGGWFPPVPQDLEDETAPVLVAVLRGFSAILAGLWTLLQECRQQTRLMTMNGPFLDMLAADYFGPDGLARRTSEQDRDYRARIVSSLVAQKSTREAVFNALLSVTGVAPTIFEPLNTADCHALASSAVPAGGGGYGYGCAGLRYGSRQGGQFFVETALGHAADAHVIYQAIEKTAASGITGWVKVSK